MGSFATKDGMLVLSALVQVIQENKQYLSDIDGLIGDGDHGINMNKGFRLCGEKLQENPGDLAHGLKTLSNVLMTKIGGSMGPLYGMFFKAMGQSCEGKEFIEAADFGKMLTAGRNKIQSISSAKPGDKTLLDVLIPAEDAYQTAFQARDAFDVCLDKMSQAAEEGRDATKDMVAKVGRSSRLGERSKGVIDAGAASCCLILQTFSVTIKENLSTGA